jgi:hypothetical protein
MAAMLTIRPVENRDLPVIWALSVLPNVGETADLSVAFPLPPAEALPTAAFDDLADPGKTFTAAGGDLIVAEVDGHIVAMAASGPSLRYPAELRSCACGCIRRDGASASAQR